MKKNNRIIVQKLMAILLIFLSIALQVAAAGIVFNGATIVAIILLAAGITLFIFNFEDIKNWIVNEYFDFKDNEIDVIPFLDPSEYDEETKECIVIQFPETSD